MIKIDEEKKKAMQNRYCFYNESKEEKTECKENEAARAKLPS